MEYLLKNLQGGRTYAVQIRSVSGDDVSEWSPTFQVTANSDATVPRAPTGLTGSVQGSSFVLSWTPPTRNTNNTFVKDIKDYELTITDGVTTVKRYYPTAKAQYSFEDNTTDFTTPKASLTFSVKTRDKTGNLSAATSSLVLTNTSPATVTGVTATTSFAGANVKWNKVADTDIAVYEVYYGTTAGFTPDTTTFSNLGYSGTNVNAVIDSITSGTYYFKVCAVDVFGQRGGFGSSAGTSVGSGSSGSAVAVQDEGSTLTSGVTSINFTGGGVTATNSGTAVTVTIPGAGAGFAADIGNGSSTTFTLTHNLGTKDVLVQIFENGSPYSQIDAEIRRTTVNAVDVVFSVAPTTNQYRVVVEPNTGGGGGGSTIYDGRWYKAAAEDTVDEFNDNSLGGSWVRVDSSGGSSRATWTEGRDVLSVYNSGGDAAGELHGMMIPIGTSMVTGDAFITCFTMMGTLGVSYSMAGIILADGTTYGSGNQVHSLSFMTASSPSQQNDVRTASGYSSVSSSAAISTVQGVRTFIRLVKLASNAWRTDVSPDGVSWILGTATVTLSFTPTHVGLLSSSWSTSNKHITSYEFLRRVSGVS